MSDQKIPSDIQEHLDKYYRDETLQVRAAYLDGRLDERSDREKEMEELLEWLIKENWMEHPLLTSLKEIIQLWQQQQKSK